MTLLLRICAGLLLSAGPLTAAAPLRSPENQVFQWAHTATSAPWPDGSTRTATLYLWVPETCTRVRGLVILATNVPEHLLAGHAAIRRACRENDLALVWAVPTFWRFGKVAPVPGGTPVAVKSLPGSDARQVAFLEQLLQGLADRSGYAEIARAPWLPVGESGHLLMVCALVDERPERCLAAICVKNPHPPRNRTVPMLWTLGTGQEWGQAKVDLRTHWLDTGDYAGWMTDRARDDWPLSLVVEPGTGHFYCSDAMADYFGGYIAAAARARLPETEGAPLRPVQLDAGVLAPLPLPGVAATPVRAHPAVPPAERAHPWFFDAGLAREAQRLTAADWQAAPQCVGFVAGRGVTLDPFSLNSVSRATIEGDGDFELRGVLLDRIPAGFVGAGEPLARAGGEPVVEWICGPVAPRPEGGFRIALDRTWKTGAACYLIARHEGDARTRRSVQPLHVTLVENQAGAENLITFAPPADQPAGTRSIPLQARASSGLPVEFFVVSGPAIVRDGQLEFTPLPPRARWPVEIVVAAWQWGRATAPRVRTAPLVHRTLRLLPAAPATR